jgi:hypothetical protein
MIYGLEFVRKIRSIIVFTKRITGDIDKASLGILLILERKFVRSHRNIIVNI